MLRRGPCSFRRSPLLLLNRRRVDATLRGGERTVAPQVIDFSGGQPTAVSPMRCSDRQQAGLEDSHGVLQRFARRLKVAVTRMRTCHRCVHGGRVADIQGLVAVAPRSCGGCRRERRLNRPTGGEHSRTFLLRCAASMIVFHLTSRGAMRVKNIERGAARSLRMRKAVPTTTQPHSNSALNDADF
jgi:hypothetical protein